MYFVQSQTILSYLKNWKKFVFSKFWQNAFLAIFCVTNSVQFLVSWKSEMTFFETFRKVFQWVANTFRSHSKQLWEVKTHSRKFIQHLSTFSFPSYCPSECLEHSLILTDWFQDDNCGMYDPPLSMVALKGLFSISHKSECRVRAIWVSFNRFKMMQIDYR